MSEGLSDVIEPDDVASHAVALVERLGWPRHLWRVAAQVSREVDRLDPTRIRDDKSPDGPQVLAAAQHHLDEACSLLSRLSYKPS